VIFRFVYVGGIVDHYCLNILLWNYCTFLNFFGRYQHPVEKYYVSCVEMTKDDIGNYILVQS